ncbi:MAG TPA: sigma-70 family RNA polymerase sigma factor [Actinomycetes bacterium]
MSHRSAPGPHAACPEGRSRRAAAAPADPPVAAGGADLLARLRAKDAGAWEEVVERYAGLIWAVARAHRLDAAKAADVSQVTWLRLLQHVNAVREPERLGAWLATTARRECLRVIGAGRRDVPVGDGAELQQGESAASPEDALLGLERDVALRHALESVSPRCRRLLRLLFTDPEPSYAEVSAALGMPVGSVGPTRARCLDCLRRDRRLRALL